VHNQMEKMKEEEIKKSELVGQNENFYSNKRFLMISLTANSGDYKNLQEFVFINFLTL